MASAAALLPGVKVTVQSGVFEGRTATVISNEVVPDGEPNMRKILINVDEVGETYILPRLLEIGDSFRPRQQQQQGMAALRLDQLEGTQSKVTIPTARAITDPMDPALDCFRPSRALLKKYVKRRVPGGMWDTDYLLAVRDDRNEEGYSPNVAFVGETQSGKTMLVQVLAILAADRDGLPKPYPVFTLNGSSGITAYDLYGQTTAVELQGQEVLVWMEGMVPMALKCGAFLYFDEFNAVPPPQAVAIHPILDDRREFTNTQKAIPDGHGGFRPEIVKAAKSTWIFTTINPGYKGTQSMAEATTNRFKWLQWDYDPDTEKVLVPSVTVRMIGDALRNTRAMRTITVPVGTSALQKLNNDCARYGVENALWSFVSMFPVMERAKVEAVIESRGFKDLLNVEFPAEDVLFKGEPIVSDVVSASDVSEDD